MSIPGCGFRMESEKDFAVYKLPAFARSAAKAGNASLSLSARRERMSPSQTAASH